MFKNADRDPLAVPSRAPRRASVGPTRRTAAGGPPADHQQFFDPHATFSSEGSGPVGAGGGYQPDYPVLQHEGQDPSYDPYDVHDPHGDDQLDALKDQWQSEGRFAAANPFDVPLQKPLTNPFGPTENQSWSNNTDPSGMPNHYTPNGKDWRTKLKNVTTGQPWNNGRVHTEDEIHQMLQKNPPQHDPNNPFGGPAPAAPQNPFQASAQPLPHQIARVLDREARTFMDAEGNTDDRSELLYRARRHAGNLTSTWTPEASHRVTEAFCGRVAALIPSPRRVAAQPVTEFADFDDSLLY